MTEWACCGDMEMCHSGYMIFSVLIAYVDETGDTGDPDKKGSSSCFALGCVLVDSGDWADALDSMLAFRRGTRKAFGIPLRAELKANYLIRGNGPLKDMSISPRQRNYIYREHLRQLAQIKARAFAVLTDKEKMHASGERCLYVTWEMLLQRLDRTTNYENKEIIIVHDEGPDLKVRGYVRKARRHLTAGNIGGAGGRSFQVRKLIDDPIPRDSQQSYFLQLADMVAYAAWRTYMPPSQGVARVVPSSMWSNIGKATHTVVNGLSLNGSVPGVVLRTS